MKRYQATIIMTVWAVCGLALAVAAQNEKKAGGPPPLKVDKANPLLLDEPKAGEVSKAAPAAHKLICYDCHGNYKEESLAETHAAKGITCVTCHGESKAHSGDEANVTPPTTMYAREAIAQRCRMCHSSHDAAPEKVIARWQERGLKMEAKKVVCTDCHGEHRLKVRTVRWDKKTRKVLPPEKAGK